MAANRKLSYLVFATAAFAAVPAGAQLAPSGSLGKGAWFAPAGHPPLGLNPGRSTISLSCNSFAFLCDDSNLPARSFDGRAVSSRWALEMGQVELGRATGLGSRSTSQFNGLNMSLVGNAPLGHSLRLFGKLGTSWGRAESSNLAFGGGAVSSEQGFGLTYGAGVGYNFTPKISATLEWDSSDLRIGGGPREPVRATSIGLQLRY